MSLLSESTCKSHVSFCVQISSSVQVLAIFYLPLLCKKKSILRPNRRKFSSLFEHLAINVAIRTLLYLQFFLHRKSITIPLVCVNPTYVLRIGEFKANYVGQGT